MKKAELTDAQVEQEIERLTHSPYVALARAEQRAKYQRRQCLYQLRYMEKRGRELDQEGKDECFFEEMTDYMDE